MERQECQGHPEAPPPPSTLLPSPSSHLPPVQDTSLSGPSPGSRGVIDTDSSCMVDKMDTFVTNGVATIDGNISESIPQVQFGSLPKVTLNMQTSNQTTTNEQAVGVKTDATQTIHPFVVPQTVHMHSSVIANLIPKNFDGTGFDTRKQKFVVEKFLDFQMVDSKPIMEQAGELRLLTHEIIAEGMFICEAFQVAAFIEKLPPTWRDYKCYLKLKQKAMTIEDLMVRLRTESNRRKAYGHLDAEHNTNLVEHKKKGKKRKFQSENSNNFKKQATKKLSGKCHKVDECPNKGDQCTMTEDKVLDSDVCIVMSEVDMVRSNPMEWWYNTGVTRHICFDKGMFTSYRQNKSDVHLFMGNSSTYKVVGLGKVVLKLASEKELTLTNVMHVPNIQKNMISGTLLSKNGFAVKIVYDKLVLTKKGVHLAEGYVNDGLFKMNVMTVVS